MFEGYALPTTPEAMELIGDLWADPQVTFAMKVIGLLAGFFVALMTLSKSARASFRATQATIYGFAHVFTKVFEKDSHINSLLYALDDPDLQVVGAGGKEDCKVTLKTCRGVVVEVFGTDDKLSYTDVKLWVNNNEDDWPDLTKKEQKLIIGKVRQAYTSALERDRLSRRATRSTHIGGGNIPENFVVVNQANTASNVPTLSKYSPNHKRRA